MIIKQSEVKYWHFGSKVWSVHLQWGVRSTTCQVVGYGAQAQISFLCPHGNKCRCQDTVDNRWIQSFKSPRKQRDTWLYAKLRDRFQVQFQMKRIQPVTAVTPSMIPMSKDLYIIHCIADLLSHSGKLRRRTNKNPSMQTHGHDWMKVAPVQ